MKVDRKKHPIWREYSGALVLCKQNLPDPENELRRIIYRTEQCFADRIVKSSDHASLPETWLTDPQERLCTERDAPVRSHTTLRDIDWSAYGNSRKDPVNDKVSVILLNLRPVFLIEFLACVYRYAVIYRVRCGSSERDCIVLCRGWKTIRATIPNIILIAKYYLFGKHPVTVGR